MFAPLFHKVYLTGNSTGGSYCSSHVPLTKVKLTSTSYPVPKKLGKFVVTVGRLRRLQRRSTLERKEVCRCWGGSAISVAAKFCWFGVAVVTAEPNSWQFGCWFYLYNVVNSSCSFVSISKRVRAGNLSMMVSIRAFFVLKWRTDSYSRSSLLSSSAVCRYCWNYCIFCYSLVQVRLFDGCSLSV